MKKNIAIIPARGGSKRIPRKNIKVFLGKPIIAYSIDAAIRSNCFDEIMVSTDDEEIAEVAKKYGANVPFFRSKENSNDFAGLAEVVEEVMLIYDKREMVFNHFCCILPTAPLISHEKIIQGHDLIMNSGVEAVIPVVRFSYPIQRALEIVEEKPKMIYPENYHKRSQDLNPAFHDVGQFYWLQTKSFLKNKRFFVENSGILEIPEIEVHDIDSEQDWKIAELKYRIMRNLI